MYKYFLFFFEKKWLKHLFYMIFLYIYPRKVEMHESESTFFLEKG